MLVDAARLAQAAVEAFGDARSPAGIARQEHQRRVVADLGA